MSSYIIMKFARISSSSSPPQKSFIIYLTIILGNDYHCHFGKKFQRKGWLEASVPGGENEVKLVPLDMHELNTLLFLSGLMRLYYKEGLHSLLDVF